MSLPLAHPCSTGTILHGRLAHPCGMVQCSIGQPVPYSYNTPSADPCRTDTIPPSAELGGPCGLGHCQVGWPVWYGDNSLKGMKRNGRPRIIGAQRPRAIIARTDLEDQRAEGLCNCSVTYSENEISTFCPFFSIASSAEKGFRSGLQRRPSLFTYDSRIKSQGKMQVPTRNQSRLHQSCWKRS